MHKSGIGPNTAQEFAAGVNQSGGYSIASKNIYRAIECESFWRALLEPLRPDGRLTYRVFQPPTPSTSLSASFGPHVPGSYSYIGLGP